MSNSDSTVVINPVVDSVSSVVDNTPAKRKPGRPRKGEIVEKQKRGAIGRPKGDAAIINEYKARMLASPKSAKVLEAIFDAALNDDHKNQASAWKLIVDRIMPVSAFEKEVGSNGGSRPSVNITISNIGGTTEVNGNDYIDYDEVIDND